MAMLRQLTPSQQDAQGTGIVSNRAMWPSTVLLRLDYGLSENGPFILITRVPRSLSDTGHPYLALGAVNGVRG